MENNIIPVGRDMTIEQIVDEINKCDETIYNIVFRNEGWAFTLWNPARCGMVKHQQLQSNDVSWTKGLETTGLRPTIREAAEATLRLVLERRIAKKKGPPEPPAHPESQLIKEGTIPEKEDKEDRKTQYEETK